MKNTFQIIIIGGGTAGIMTAAQFKRKDSTLDIAIVEPNTQHFYQPAFTLVGAGTYKYKNTHRAMADVIPEGVTWIKDAAKEITPENNSLTTNSGKEYSYEYLVVAPGLVMELSLIEGLPEALGKGVVCSNYTNPRHTWEVLKNFKGGNAVFTQASTPIKCGGAPQKIAYLTADYLKKHNLADKSNVYFATPGSVIFGVKPIRETLEKVIDRYNMHFKPFHNPYKIDADKQIIYFKSTEIDENDCVINQDDNIKCHEQNGETIIEMHYDMLHIAPPQAAPKFIRNSPLATKKGWLDVNHHSLQHNKYPNIFGIGDVVDLPTAKTGAAVGKQAPVVVDNIIKLINNQEANNQSYMGYSSCPLVTAYGKMVLAEFDYEGNFTPDPNLKKLLVFNSAKEHWRLWLLKKYGLPYLYWNIMLKGKTV